MSSGEVTPFSVKFIEADGSRSSLLEVNMSGMISHTKSGEQ